MKKNLKKWIFIALVIAYIGVWWWIMSSSASLNCESGPLLQARGWCLARRGAMLSVFAIWIGAWVRAGGKVAMDRGHHPAIGWFIGGIFEFLGCFIMMMMWTPKDTPWFWPHKCPRCGKKTQRGEKGLCEDCFYGRTSQPKTQ